MKSTEDWSNLVFIFFTIAVIGFGGYQYYGLSSRHTVTLSQLASSTEKINQLEAIVAQNKQENTDLNTSLVEEKQRNDLLAEDVAGISGTIGNLQKLSQTDKELLQKYSKIAFLSENYVPSSLVTITSQYLFDEKKPEQIHANVWPRLQAMILSASSAGVDLKIVSAYRSFDEQAKVKTSHILTYGSGANKFSADQGYSEHQLGTTVDLADKTGTLTTAFEKTKVYDWLLANAYRYGFVISYPKNNTYYQFEPWHWRFVGVKLATQLHDTNKYFYNLSQREISTFLINIFD